MSGSDPTAGSREADTTPVGINTSCPQCGAPIPAFESRCSACGHHRAVGDDEQREALRQRLQAGIGTAYELLDLLGKGGMGVVFRARERALERDVALKVLAFDPVMAPEAFARFEREAKLAARLDHPHIVPIFAVGQGQSIAFYTMRLVRGGSLEDLLARETKLAPPRAVRYLRDVAAALDHAHAHGVVHRDVKPANVMLGDDDHVVVADFGIARAVEGGGGLTSTGVVGSPAYMAPEQWQGAAIDGRADQYALGILAYELLTGRRPYRDATMHQLLRMHLTEDLPDITNDLGPASAAVRDALRRATAKEPAQRFESAGDFVKALDASISGGVTAAHSAPTIISGRVTPPPMPATPVRRAAPRGGKALPIAAVLVLGSIGAYAAITSRSETSTPAAPIPARSETVLVQQPSRPETVLVRQNAPAETVRVPQSGAGSATAGAAANAISPGASNGGSGAGAAPAAGSTTGYVMIAHPLVPMGRYIIDGAPTPARRPSVYPLAEGQHRVAFRSTVPTFPEQVLVRVTRGDTVRALFLPLEGGGARGDSMRAQLRERLRRSGGVITDDGRGGGGRRGRAARGSAPPVRGDTL